MKEREVVMKQKSVNEHRRWVLENMLSGDRSEYALTVYADVCRMFDIDNPEIRLCKALGIPCYDWQEACFRMHKAIQEGDDDAIVELLQYAVYRLDRQIARAQKYLETGSFCMTEEDFEKYSK